MRKALKEKATSLPTLVKPNLEDPKKKKSVKKDGASSSKPKSNVFDVEQLNQQGAEEEVDMLQKIINEKLPKREVADYLQEFANQLTIKKME